MARDDSAYRVAGIGWPVSGGKEEQGGVVKTLWMAGPDVTLSTGMLDINLQYMERHDDDPAFIGSTGKTTSRGFLGELVFAPNGDMSKWYGTALHEKHIFNTAQRLLNNKKEYDAMAAATNPYEDGFASRRTVHALKRHFGFSTAPFKEFRPS